MTQENQTHVKDTAKNVMARNNPLAQGRQLALWIGALIFGAVLGWMNVPFLNQLFNFIATVFTRLFQFIAVPTIALAVITTLSMMGSKEETKRIFQAHHHLYPAHDYLCRRDWPAPLSLDPAGQPADRGHRCRRDECPPEHWQDELL